MFLPCPSVRPWGSNSFRVKHALWGFKKVWGVFEIFRACVVVCVRHAFLKFCGLNLS